MTAIPLPVTPPAAAPPMPDPGRYAAALDELVEIGMEVARMVRGRVRALGGEPAGEGLVEREGVTELAAAFDVVARAVRRTVHLARSVDRPAPVAGSAGPIMARAQIIRAVEDRIHRDVSDTEQVEGLRAELYERMDAPEFSDELGDRPVEEVIREIERDLGVGGRAGSASPWRRRTPTVVATLYARARGERVAVRDDFEVIDTAAAAARPRDGAGIPAGCGLPTSPRSPEVSACEAEEQAGWALLLEEARLRLSG